METSHPKLSVIIPGSRNIGTDLLIKTVRSPHLIVSGLGGVFSGFNKHVERIAKEFCVDPRDVLFELGRHNQLQDRTI